MEFDAFLNGFETLFTFKYIIACMVGALLGTLIGALSVPYMNGAFQTRFLLGCSKIQKG